MMIFATSLILAVVAAVAASILAFRLKGVSPAVHDSVDAPVGTEWWPFWVFHLLSRSKWRHLPAGLRSLAFIAISTLAIALVLLAFLLFRFAAGGGSL
jgi:hypothetical protein